MGEHLDLVNLVPQRQERALPFRKRELAGDNDPLVDGDGLQPEVLAEFAQPIRLGRFRPAARDGGLGVLEAGEQAPVKTG